MEGFGWIEHWVWCRSRRCNINSSSSNVSSILSHYIVTADWLVKYDEYLLQMKVSGQDINWCRLVLNGAWQ